MLEKKKNENKSMCKKVINKRICSIRRLITDTKFQPRPSNQFYWFTLRIYVEQKYHQKREENRAK